jgi:DNA-nicking Smr family endonuclease
VPRWLAEPDLRPYIVSFTTAAAKHGGEGALYVHLRVAGRISASTGEFD